jgi:citrate lyase subunit beta/citryl-CoA lyase
LIVRAIQTDTSTLFPEVQVQILRTLLFVPAIRERMLASARRSGADAIVLDLEDSVPANEKPAARRAAANAVSGSAASDKAMFVRLNGIGSSLTHDDLMAVIAPGLNGVVLPKVESAQDLRDLDVMIREAEMANGVRPGDIATVPIIESARGVLRCEEIARASDRVMALAIGGEDYSRDIGTDRDPAGVGLQHVRAVVVQVATAYGLLSIDTPYADYGDERGLIAETRLAKATGLKGKFVIHPDQIDAVNKVFTPTTAAIAAARRIIKAYDEGVASGAGAISVDGRMVDAPIAERARALVALAERAPSSSKKRSART